MADSYYMLIASLPHLPVRFDSGRLPISRDSLRERLNLLDTNHRAIVNQVNAFFVWDRQLLNQLDSDVLRTYQQMLREISNLLLLRLIEHRINMRTIVAAIRHRRLSAAPPLGIGPLLDVIRRNWHQPNFGLLSRYGWIEPFTRAFMEGRAEDGQHILFTDLWNTWSRIAQEYHFSFESVIMYLARWEILDRWTSQSELEGHRRFQALLSETLGEYAKLF